MNVLGRVTPVASLGCHRKVRRSTQVAIAALDFCVAPVQLELRRGVIEGPQDFPLFRHVTALTTQVRVVRVRMTGFAPVGREMVLAERTR